MTSECCRICDDNNNKEWLPYVKLLMKINTIITVKSGNVYPDDSINVDEASLVKFKKIIDRLKNLVNKDDIPDGKIIVDMMENKPVIIGVSDFPEEHQDSIRKIFF